LRIDTIPEVPKWFWQQFSAAAGVFTIGEVFDGRIDYVSDYQNCCIDATLNYPLHFEMNNCFAYDQSMKKIESVIQTINKSFKDPSLLGVFVSNHDNPRFLNMSNRWNRIKAALAFSVVTSI